MLQLATSTCRPVPLPAYLAPIQMLRLRERLLDLRRQARSWIEESRVELRVEQMDRDEVDRATTESHYESSLQKLHQGEELLRAVEGAIRRMEEGTYGYCEESGEPIGAARLLAHPCATLSVEAQAERERRRGMVRGGVASRMIQ